MSISPAHEVPRPEYPRPQMVRQDWLNLNGPWQFEIDAGDSGLDRGLRERELSQTITVPFAPESELSGLGHTDFMEAVWYRRTVTIPAAWAGRRTLLHFGAVDHDATVWVNGVEVARHRGGFSPFTADLSEEVRPGEDATIVVRARDPRQGSQARGKQSTRYGNYECLYTRTTGIWQTVWLEPVPDVHLSRPRITPDVANSSFTVVTPLSGNRPGTSVRVTVSDREGVVATATARADVDLAPSLRLELDRVHLWEPGEGYLYDVRVQLLDAGGAVTDTVDSYAGLRSIAIDGKRVLINGRPVFQRLVLDQGYYPDGLMTAPTDAALLRDIELSVAAGFNGARLHQKVFEERFLYHADRLGYLVWGEFGDWGASTGHEQQPTASFITQWLEVLERDVSHPSIIGWCPLNETSEAIHDRVAQLDDVTRGMYLATKLADPTRPVVDASGYSHRVPETDIYDSHNYEQEPTAFAGQLSGLSKNEPFVNTTSGDRPISVPYRGQPYFVSEYGGIWWNPELAGTEQDATRVGSWGYGQRVRTEEEFHVRFAGLTEALLENADMFGYCYTQLTDVFQEENGIYRFDRSSKLDVERIRQVQSQPAATERSS
ncbi:glycoside hydrolase family 2 protein [Nonomuraea insulae]|uniref:Glycoside hydrolase family 2 protein n=1 Tax=Nonomuraea insulae TaxID=1616787 RepID=A0ABW1CJF9_9ACTN